MKLAILLSVFGIRWYSNCHRGLAGAGTARRRHSRNEIGRASHCPRVPVATPADRQPGKSHDPLHSSCVVEFCSLGARSGAHNEADCVVCPFPTVQDIEESLRTLPGGEWAGVASTIHWEHQMAVTCSALKDIWSITKRDCTCLVAGTLNSNDGTAPSGQAMAVASRLTQRPLPVGRPVGVSATSLRTGTETSSTCRPLGQGVQIPSAADDRFPPGSDRVVRHICHRRRAAVPQESDELPHWQAKFHSRHRITGPHRPPCCSSAPDLGWSHFWREMRKFGNALRHQPDRPAQTFCSWWRLPATTRQQVGLLPHVRGRSGSRLQSAARGGAERRRKRCASPRVLPPTIDNTIASIPKRLEWIIKGNGRRTKHWTWYEDIFLLNEITSKRFYGKLMGPLCAVCQSVDIKNHVFEFWSLVTLCLVKFGSGQNCASPQQIDR